MVRYKHIIWDWNGTLLDDAWLCVESMNKMLRARNRPLLTTERYGRAFGFPVIEYYRRLGFDFDVESWDAVATEYIDEYDRRRFECELQTDAVRVLEWCLDAGYGQSLLSAYKQPALEEIVDHFDVRRLFRKISGHTNHYAEGKVGHGRRLLDELDLSGADVLLVGDTDHDFEVAQDIGAACVLVAAGHQSIERLERCRVPVLKTLSEVKQLIESTSG